MVTDRGLFDRHDTSHPIASIFGDVGKLDEAVDSLPEIDIWGINAYRGISCQTWINRCWMHRFATPLDKLATLAQGPWLIAIQVKSEWVAFIPDVYDPWVNAWMNAACVPRGFGNLFRQYEDATSKPMFFGISAALSKLDKSRPKVFVGVVWLKQRSASLR